jgi:Fungal potassium channel
MAKKSGNKKPKTNSFMLLEKGPKWKREQVSDHKFDFIDIEEFYDPGCWTKMKYMMIFLSVIKSTLTYLADLWTAGILLSSVVRTKLFEGHPPIPQ